MRRALQIIAVLLAGSSAFAATPGYTAAERARTNEFLKRIAARRVVKTVAADYAQIYLKRSYVVDIDPAETLAVELLSTSGIPSRDQLQYFAWGLDAFVNGAAIEDVLDTFKNVIKNHYGADRAFYLQNLLAAASPYSSPAPLIKILKRAENNGLVGKRKQDFTFWLVSTIQKGEDPLLLARMFDAMTKTVVGVTAQVDYLQRFYAAIQSGVPPTELAAVVERISENASTGKQFDQQYQQILTLYASGTPLSEALDRVIPRKKDTGAGPIRRGF